MVCIIRPSNGTSYFSKADIHALRVSIDLSLPLARAVPNRTIAHPAIIIAATFSPRKAAPHIIPKIGIRNVTDAA